MRQFTYMALVVALGFGLQAAGAPQSPQDPDDPGPPKIKRGKPAPSTEPAKRTPAAKAPAQASAPPSPPAAQPATPERGSPRRPAETHGEPGQAAAQPPPDPRQALIERARQAAESFSEKLPNYVCQQFTTRYMGRGSPAKWEAQDVVSASVVYEGGKESYKNIAVNGRPTGAKSMEELSGSWSTGEFGTILNNIFAPGTAAQFRFRQDSTASGLAAAVYDFEVAQPNSAWQVHAESSMTVPAYRGALWIDKQSGRVLRIEMQAVRLPSSFPLDTVETAIDYAFVNIGTQRFLLPVHSETLSCQRGTNFCARNTIDFRNYRKFTAESNITFDK